ncbi:hypothetical protein FA95DRAFT_1609488, partial [Auriscalpium vulgare]
MDTSSSVPSPLTGSGLPSSPFSSPAPPLTGEILLANALPSPRPNPIATAHLSRRVANDLEAASDALRAAHEASRRHNAPSTPDMSQPNSRAGSRASARTSASVMGSQASVLSHFNARLQAKLDGNKCLPAELRQPDAAKAITDALAEPQAGDDGFDSPQKELGDILSSYLLQEDCVDRGASQYRYALGPEMTQIVVFLLGAYERAVQGMLALEDDSPAVTWLIDPGAGIVSALHGAADFRVLAVAFSAFQMRLREANSIVAQRYELHHGSPYVPPARPKRLHTHKRPIPTALPASNPPPAHDIPQLTL